MVRSLRCFSNSQHTETCYRPKCVTILWRRFNLDGRTPYSKLNFCVLSSLIKSPSVRRLSNHSTAFDYYCGYSFTTATLDATHVVGMFVVTGNFKNVTSRDKLNQFCKEANAAPVPCMVDLAMPMFYGANILQWYFTQLIYRFAVSSGTGTRDRFTTLQFT